ncbi:hypothetical protein [Lacrimispora sp.]|uniref:hypothetical protein n=1 Tax=Lacrimispora sp. TaxID=2719234 RepID=UPI0028AF8CC3|nr:hypothetical protein [Lacrimispora sp.]
MLKLKKSKKDKISKTKPQKGKAGKIKLNKAKPSKTTKDKRKGLLPKNRRVLVLMAAALLIVIMGSVQAIILLTSQKKDMSEEKAEEAPTYYFSKDEDISSVTEIVGDRDFERQEASEASLETETKETGDQTEEPKESSADASSQTSSLEACYKYFHVEDTSADIKSYMDYLEGKRNFINVTDKSPQSESGQPSAEETPKSSSEIYQLAGPSKDSTSYLSITLESEADSYTVTTSKENQPWSTYFKDQWDQQKKIIADFEKQPKATTTIEQAVDSVRAQGQEKLGLPEAIDSYEYIAAPGISKIDGNNYYTVRTYKRQPDDTLIYVATYLFDYNTSSVAFQYDEVTGKATPLS